MAELLLITATIALIILFRDINNDQIAYSGSESNLSEANEYYWLLKNNRIPVKYVIPYNWENFYRFGYKKSSVHIKVNKKDMDKAIKLMMDYRTEKRKMQRNIAADRNRE